MAKKGSKLVKSEAVQVRFDPILKMAAELAAGQERRTLSSFTEMAVDRAVKEVMIANKEGREVSAWEVAHECWHDHPAQRFDALASHYYGVLTLRERKIFSALMRLRCDHRTSVTYMPSTIYYHDDVWRALGQFADDAMTWDELAAVVVAAVAARKTA